MKSVLSRAFVFVALMVGSVQTEADQAGPDTMLNRSPDAAYTAIGKGTDSCGNWTAARHELQASGVEQWFLGFLSGVGFDAVDGTDPLKRQDADGVWRWLDSYCQAHPLDRITRAGAAFVARRPRPTRS
ncbi:MAG: hypothetical protein WB902_18475 [Acetobacteraceae bacterium]|jgi:hypothetical protein